MHHKPEPQGGRGIQSNHQLMRSEQTFSSLVASCRALDQLIFDEELVSTGARANLQAGAQEGLQSVQTSSSPNSRLGTIPALQYWCPTWQESGGEETAAAGKEITGH